MARRWLAALRPLLALPAGSTVDDSTVGASSGAFTYSGAWEACSACGPHDVGIAGATLTTSRAAGDAAQIQIDVEEGGRVTAYLSLGRGPVRM